MNLKVQCLLGILVFSCSTLSAQQVEERIEQAYFELLTRQWQAEQEVKEGLQRISPELYPEFQEVLELPGNEAMLPWTYFLERVSRAENGDDLAELCTETRKISMMLKRFHTLQLMDPYSQSLIDTSRSVRRLRFFGIEEGDKVAEIGFGHGYILNLLALVYQQVEVYANELDHYHLKGKQKDLQEEFTQDRRDNFYFLAGHPQSTNLEGQELDLIIMENVFHHVGEPTLFLESMLKSLHENGEVAIIEEFLDSGRAEGCRDRMEQKVLERLFGDAGFELLKVQELPAQYRTMLRFGRKSEGNLQE
jgi:ubiquinone/menaquinone biosynthesis C-methylase UbiE